MIAKYRKLLALAILLVLCGWLVRRNVFAPSETTLISARRGNAIDAALSNRPPGQQKTAGQPGTSSSRRAPEPVADLDPTLRLDLLEAARAVKYKGSSRNIFELYTPPPPPAPPVRPATPLHSAGSGAETPAIPKPPAFPFKFYGTAQPTGKTTKRAFLTNGEDILIANEGDVVARFYKVNRIGPTSVEIEDTRSKQRQQLPLAEDMAGTGAETGTPPGAGAGGASSSPPNVPGGPGQPNRLGWTGGPGQLPPPRQDPFTKPGTATPGGTSPGAGPGADAGDEP